MGNSIGNSIWYLEIAPLTELERGSHISLCLQLKYDVVTSKLLYLVTGSNQQHRLMLQSYRRQYNLFERVSYVSLMLSSPKFGRTTTNVVDVATLLVGSIICLRGLCMSNVIIYQHIKDSSFQEKNSEQPPKYFSKNKSEISILLWNPRWTNYSEILSISY